MKLTLQELLNATGGRLLSGKVSAHGGVGSIQGRVFEGISTDSRSVRPGDLFIAIRGERYDGHDFVGAAFRKGASGAVVHRNIRCSGRILVRVNDTLRALGDIARHWRSRHFIPLAAITGSNGKTTTKEIMAGILTSGGYRVLKTEGNLNNLIGVPLMLFRLGPRIETAVLELGTNRFGEIDRLAEISMPQVGIITSIGKAHIQFFKSIRGVARAKAELLGRLTKDDAAVLNADDPYVVKIGRKCPAKKMFFGFKKGSHVRCLSAEEKGIKGTSISVDVLGRRMDLDVPLPGLHNVSNALAAIAGACALDDAVSRSEIQEGLRCGARLPGRFRIIRKKGFVIIDDTYNANPCSMEAALRTVCSLKGSARGAAVLGDMLELGREKNREHEELGRLVASLGLEFVIAIGKSARRVRSGALSEGMSRENFRIARSHEEAVRIAKGFLKVRDWVLVKGSRGMHMEKIIEGF